MTHKPAAFLGLGSNIGDRTETLRRALRQIPELAAVSSLYETEPVGGPEQSAYFNIVIKLETSKTPRQLLQLCAELETDAGRERTIRWGPRTLDVDVLLVEAPSHGLTPPDGCSVDDGLLVVEEPDLQVPHPRMAQRNFVMLPLLEIAPEVAQHGLLQLADGEKPIGEVRSLGGL